MLHLCLTFSCIQPGFINFLNSWITLLTCLLDITADSRAGVDFILFSQAFNMLNLIDGYWYKIVPSCFVEENVRALIYTPWIGTIVESLELLLAHWLQKLVKIQRIIYFSKFYLRYLEFRTAKNLSSPTEVVYNIYTEWNDLQVLLEIQSNMGLPGILISSSFEISGDVFGSWV